MGTKRTARMIFIRGSNNPRTPLSEQVVKWELGIPILEQVIKLEFKLCEGTGPFAAVVILLHVLSHVCRGYWPVWQQKVTGNDICLCLPPRDAHGRSRTG